MTHRLARSSVAVLGLLLAACSFLEPREDPTRFFVLSAATNAGPAPAADPGLLVVLGPVHLPDYLLRPEIVQRAGPNQVEPSRVDRWAEPIDRGLVRVLCLDLGARLPRRSVVPFPAARGDEPGVQVELEIAAFEADRAGQARLEGRWRVRGPRSARDGVEEFRLERPAASQETPATVAAMSALLADLADEIAAGLSAGDAR